MNIEENYSLYSIIQLVNHKAAVSKNMIHALHNGDTFAFAAPTFGLENRMLCNFHLLYLTSSYFLLQILV